MATNEIKTASVLAFERKLDPSDALFYAGKWDDRKNSQQWKSIFVREKAVRGTISNRMKTKDIDPAKLDKDIQKPNLQMIDVATLPNNCDTLEVRFTLRVLGGAGVPSACNNAAYQTKLNDMVASYVKAHQFKELAQRYAYNLANGRFLWRNRIGMENIEVQISHRHDKDKSKTWNFNALELSLREFNYEGKYKSEIQTLGEVIASGLNGKSYVLLEVIAFVRIGEGQEVFPSQELILDKAANEKSKTLYTVEGIAAIHSQKIGNALRTIDTWYPDDLGLGPIAVEPYGSVTTQGKAYRQPKQKVDFYNLLDKWVLKDEAPDVGNQHYVMANLVRGGVFGDSDKE